jgi:hypothetical protein
MSTTTQEPGRPKFALRQFARTAKGVRVPSGRSREGRLLLAFRETLIKHVGGKPSSVQLALINSATQLKMHLDRLDEASAASGEALSEHQTKVYLAWSNSLARTLKLLGLQGVPEKPPTIAELMAQSRSAA